MVRVCAACRRSYSGGRECPECGPGHPLIEASDPAARAALDARGWAGVRALYGARRAMILAIAGPLVGAGAGLVVLRRAFAVENAVDRWLWAALAALVGLGVPVAALVRGARIARRTRRGYDLPPE